MAEPNGSANGQRVVKLTKPIAGHGGTVGELRFAPLTARVLIKNKKLPFTHSRDASGRINVDVDYSIAVKYIADLTGLDELVLEQLNTADFGEAILALNEMVYGVGN